MPISEVFNVDCVSYMQTLPDKFFDLAIVDPPYGIGINMNQGRRKGQLLKHSKKNWDEVPPNQKYWEELIRVSINQIVWGANNFNWIPAHNGYVVWDKDISGDVDFSKAELAYNSQKNTISIVKIRAQTGNEVYSKKIHPTQKPIALYKWLIEKYAKAGDKIFDSHMGSQSSRIAAFNMGFDYWGCELDEEYFNDGNKRFIRETMQQSLFTPTATKSEITQTTIF